MRKYTNHKRAGCHLVLIFAGCLFLASSSFGQSTDLLFRSDDEVRGDPNAPVTLLEYSDYTCGIANNSFMKRFLAC